MTGLEKIEQRAQELLKKYAFKEPQSVWHYTSSSALLNMLENNSIWLSDFRLLNDTSELNYGLNIFKNAAEQFKGINALAPQAELVRALMQEFDRSEKFSLAYVFCVCAEEDSVTQWLSYAAKSTDPVAMKFDLQSLRNFSWNEFRTRVFPVAYRPEVQRNIANSMVRSFLTLPQCKSYLAGNVRDRSKIDFELFATMCANMCIQFKHPKFQAEQEWRVVCQFGAEHGPGQKLEFRSSGAGVTPYINIQPKDGLLPISGVMLGPKIANRIQLKSHNELLLRYDYFDAEVTMSGVPLRN